MAIRTLLLALAGTLGQVDGALSTRRSLLLSSHVSQVSRDSRDSAGATETIPCASQGVVPKLRACASKVLRLPAAAFSAASAPEALPGVDRVVVLHYSKLTDRRARLEAIFEGMGVAKASVMWLDMFDRSALTEDVNKCLFAFESADDRTKATKAHAWSQYSLFAEMVRQPQTFMASNRQGGLQGGPPRVLLLEDDVLPVSENAPDPATPKQLGAAMRASWTQRTRCLGVHSPGPVTSATSFHGKGKTGVGALPWDFAFVHGTAALNTGFMVSTSGAAKVLAQFAHHEEVEKEPQYVSRLAWTPPGRSGSAYVEAVLNSMLVCDRADVQQVAGELILNACRSYHGRGGMSGMSSKDSSLCEPLRAVAFEPPLFVQDGTGSRHRASLLAMADAELSMADCPHASDLNADAPAELKFAKPSAGLMRWPDSRDPALMWNVMQSFMSGGA